MVRGADPWLKGSMGGGRPCFDANPGCLPGNCMHMRACCRKHCNFMLLLLIIVCSKRYFRCVSSPSILY
jgi:hypothetical protein